MIFLFYFLVADGARRYLYAEHSRVTTIRAVPQVTTIIFTCLLENTEHREARKPFHAGICLLASMLLVYYILHVECFPENCNPSITT